MFGRRMPAVLVPLLVAAASGCGSDSHAASAMRTATPANTATPSVTRSATAAATPIAPTATPSLATTQTAAPSATAAPSVTAAPSPTAGGAPRVSAFGVARADDLVQQPAAFDDLGRPIFERATGQGMTIYIEGVRGAAMLNEVAYEPSGSLPGLDIIVSRPLGDGSLAVCDFDPPIIGGVPGVDPPEFSDDPMVIDASADLGCRVNDGTGLPTARTSASAACTRDESAEFDFVNPDSGIQFCLPIAKAWAFPVGDTIVAARVRDRAGRVSDPVEIVIRVAGDQPFTCEDGLGERVFTPVHRATGTTSELLSTAGDGDVSRDPWTESPIRLCAGPDLGDGTHRLTLRQDVVLGVPLSDQSELCLKFIARGSDGLLDCSGQVALDVEATQMAGNAEIEYETGLGVAAGTGGALMHAPLQVALVTDGSGCDAARFGSTYDAAFTSADATAVALDADGATLAMLSHVGAAFDCAAWREAESGVLVLPLPAADSPGGATASVLVLSE